ARAVIARVQVGERTLRNVRISCPTLELQATRMACSNATLILTVPGIETQALQGRVAYDRASHDVELDVRTSRFAGGAAHVRAWLQGRQWRAQTKLDGLAIEKLIE